MPQVDRNPSCIAIEISPHNISNDIFLLDCGEGAQRQMMKNRVGFGSISSIFLTHIHGDHILGLPGLSQTWTFDDREEPLDIYCPVGTSKYVNDCISLVGHQPTYEVRIHEVSGGDSIDREGYSIDVFETFHSTESIGFCINEDERKGKFDREKAEELGVPKHKFSNLHNGETVKLENGETIAPDQVVGPTRDGRKVVYTGDTRPNKKTIKFSKNASVLIHDGTFDSSNKQRAWESKHSTAREATYIAKKAEVEKLVLTHISSRHSNISSLKKEAKENFKDTWVAYDGMEVLVEYPEKEKETRITS